MTQWQLIDSAPRDGTAVLLWPYQTSGLYDETEVVLGYYDTYNDEWHNPESRGGFNPTHWMQLPIPPEKP